MGAKTSSRERAQHGVLYPCARVQNCVPAGMRASAPRCDRLQARRRTALLPTISTFAIDLRAPFAARLDARALRRSCARTLKLWPARARSSTMALSARACCAGAAAKAPTQRVARRNRRRRWCLGLRLDTHGGGGGGGGGGDRSHHFCSTPSSCDGVECVFAFPTGEARHRARRVHAGSMPPPASPTPPRRARWQGSVNALKGDVGRNRGRRR
jgi:hypothetical protein